MITLTLIVTFLYALAWHNQPGRDLATKPLRQPEVPQGRDKYSQRGCAGRGNM